MILGMLEPGCPQQLAEVEREVAAGGTTSALNDPSLGTHLVAHCINSIGATGEQSDVHKLLRALFDTVALRARSSLAFPIAEVHRPRAHSSRSPSLSRDPMLRWTPGA